MFYLFYFSNPPPCSLPLSHTLSVSHSLLCPPSVSPLLSLLPCWTCLSKLGRAQYTQSTGGGPCLLSINNLWNSEIQVGPVPGRLYQTREGGLPGTVERELSTCGILSVRLCRSDCVSSPSPWLTTVLQTTSAAPCVWIFWGTLWLYLVATVSVWTASVATGMRLITQGFTFVPSARLLSPRGLCFVPMPLWAWWLKRSKKADWTSTSARPREMSTPDQTMSLVTSALGRSWRLLSLVWTVWRPTARSTWSLTMNQPHLKGTSWWTSWATWTGRFVHSTRSPWSFSVEQTRCASVLSARSVSTKATTLSLLRRREARNR